jgi:hypothetical protein
MIGNGLDDFWFYKILQKIILRKTQNKSISTDVYDVHYFRVRYGLFTSAGIWKIGNGQNDFLIFQNALGKYFKDNRINL